MTLIIISVFVIILVSGLVTLLRRYKGFVDRHNFAIEYREKFIQFAKKYFESYGSGNRRGNIDSELYVWLTKNVNKIQSDLGHLGTMHYVAPFQIYQISNYQILINTIPKFRNGKIEEFDINSADDCLLRYIGVLEKTLASIKQKLKNPVVWFKEGFQEIISLPLYIFNWFGILSDTTVSKVTTNVIFKFFAGLGGLVAFASGVVTIIQGKEQTIAFFKQLFQR